MSYFEKREKDRRERAKALFDAYITNTAAGSRVPELVQKILLDAKNKGYAPWLTPNHVYPKSTPLLVQRCIRGQKGEKLFFIDIEVHDLGAEFPHQKEKVQVNLTPFGQFYLGPRHGGPDSRTVNLKLFLMENDSVEKIEKFFSDFYQQMGCVPYEE